MNTLTLAEPGWRMQAEQPSRPPEDPQEAFSLGWGLLASLGLHLLLVLPVLFLDHLMPVQQDNEQLVVELFGMVANRQTEQKTLGEKVDRQSPQPQQQVQRKQVKALTQSTADSPVQVAKQEERKEVQAAQQSTQGAEEQQKQQTLRNDTEVDQMRRYLSALKKAVKDKLVYPPEARQAGQTGAPEVSFAIGTDGQIQSGSLSIRKSSGYPLLDEAALRAVRAAAPFSPPPFPMSPKLEIPFAEDKKK